MKKKVNAVFAILEKNCHVLLGVASIIVLTAVAVDDQQLLTVGAAAGVVGLMVEGTKDLLTSEEEEDFWA